MIRKLACAALLAAALARPAAAGPLDAKAKSELVGWGTCAAILGIYEGVLEATEGTAADRDLLDRAHEAEPRMEAWFNDATQGLDASQGDEVRDQVTSLIMPRASKYVGQPDAQSQLLAEFRPDLEACVARAQGLPAAPVAPASPT